MATNRVSFGADVLNLVRRLSFERDNEGFSNYRNNPLSFCKEVLGFQPWEAQVEVIEAIAGSDNVTVRSGRAVGKSTVCAAIALWFWATRGPGCRVILTAPTAKNVQEVLWHEIRRLYLSSRRPLGGDLPTLATTGLRTKDGRQIIGITADKPEAFAGIRAPEMMMLADEASIIEPDLFTTMLGNLAGGGKLVLIGNPTRTHGFFYDSFDNDSFTKLHISTLRSPNIVEGRTVIKGLADLVWLERRKLDWGEGTPTYRVHVLGEFAEGEEGCLFPVHAIAAAESRWAESKPTGRLYIGVDPAGDSGTGDESAFCCRRGAKVLALHGRRGMTDDAHLIEVLGLIQMYHEKGEDPPAVVLDRDGPIGAKVYGVFLTHLRQHEGLFELVGLRGGERAKRQPNEYERQRDEMWASCATWMREGGSLVADVRLVRELGLLAWEEKVSGRVKVTGKDSIRKLLGRSPDRADALALSCWQPSAWGVAAVAEERPPQPRDDPYEDMPENTFDPYAGVGTMNPYGG